ncbi:AAA family ATPase [Selenomonas sp. AB3002]|uniref:AAA family ATPase n=1 Tax=Selenomonas sp. AB3002 TaxID=1392502 RepID=UPI00068AC424
MPYLILLILFLGLLFALAALVGSLCQLVLEGVKTYYVNLLLAALPAGVAYWKNRSWKGWYLYGLLLWPLACLQILLVQRDVYGWVGEKRFKKQVQREGAQAFKPHNFLRKRKNLDDLMAELNGLTGLGSVKEHLEQLFSRLKADEERRRRGLPVMGGGSLHMVFTGNPGTGKTTVARLIASIYKEMGIVRTGAFVEADRSSLVAQYIGETAILTNEKIQAALGGVLFIDEAYALYKEDNPKDFGHEAIETLLKAMEDKRDDLIVIVAGYTGEMERFLSSNPGLKSRFTNYIEFEDYRPEELLDIFTSLCRKDGYILADEAKSFMQEHFLQLYEARDKDFGNARTVRNLYQAACYAQSNRISGTALEALSDQELMTITGDDAAVAAGRQPRLQMEGAL